MNGELILPLSMAMSTLVYALAAKWYLLPRFSLDRAVAILSPLLLLHALRHIGMAFLIPGVTAEALDLRFADPAAYGDLAAAFLALVALWAVRRRWRAAAGLVWFFNIVGAVDLLNAVFQGIRHTPNGALGAMYFIPALVVPLLLVTHGVIFLLLIRGGRLAEPQTAR